VTLGEPGPLFPTHAQLFFSTPLTLKVLSLTQGTEEVGLSVGVAVGEGVTLADGAGEMVGDPIGAAEGI